jgi:hypothetical protein
VKQALALEQKKRDVKVQCVATEVTSLKKELLQVRELMAQSTKEQTAVVMSIMAQMQAAMMAASGDKNKGSGNTNTDTNTNTSEPQKTPAGGGRNVE